MIANSLRTLSFLTNQGILDAIKFSPRLDFDPMFTKQLFDDHAGDMDFMFISVPFDGDFYIHIQNHSEVSDGHSVHV